MWPKLLHSTESCASDDMLSKLFSKAKRKKPVITAYCDNPGAGYCMLWVLYQWRRWNVDGRRVDVVDVNERKNFRKFVNPLLAQLKQNAHNNDTTERTAVCKKFNMPSSNHEYTELLSTEYPDNWAFLSILFLKRRDLPTDIFVYQPTKTVLNDEQEAIRWIDHAWVHYGVPTDRTSVSMEKDEGEPKKNPRAACT